MSGGPFEDEPFHQPAGFRVARDPPGFQTQIRPLGEDAPSDRMPGIRARLAVEGEGGEQVEEVLVGGEVQVRGGDPGALGGEGLDDETAG